MNLKCMGIFLVSVNAVWASDSVRVDFAPYLWATSMHGTVQVGPKQVSISQSFIDLMKHFQGGGMLYINAHKDRWGIFGNALYSVLSDKKTLDAVAIRAQNNFGIFSGGISYAVIQKPVFGDQSPPLSLELLTGARLTINNTRIDAGLLTVKNNQSWTDPILGARFTYPIKHQVHFIVAGDVGGADGHHSYDIQTYLGYQTQKPLVFDNLTLYLGYRYLYQYFSNGTGLNYYLWNMNIRGPVLGMKTVF